MIRFLRAVALLGLSCFGCLTSCQALQPQNDSFNSTFTLSRTQTFSLNFSDAVTNDIEIAARFEQSNWATGSVFADPFYTNLPPNASNVPAGSLIKLEEFTNTSAYTIAPTLALSRIIFQSKDLNGSLVPASAYILWPYLPRYGGSAAPLVTWGHGTSGFFAECGPSHIRNLWYQFSAPYTLALAGFAVVAPDYAGLGLPYYANGSSIVHQYTAAPASGNDLLFAAEAAYAAFPEKLTKHFAVMGHSQGGGAAWGAAQQQLEVKAPGYLGTIAGSPITNATAMALDYPSGPSSSAGSMIVAKAIRSVFPEVPLSAILSPEGITALELYKEI